MDINPYNHIKKLQWNEIGGASVFYLPSEQQNKSYILKLIREVNPDLIYCNSLYSPKFTINPIRLAKKLNIKSVLAVRGMLSSGSLAVKSHKKKIFLSLVKTTGLFNKTLFHATSEEETTDIINVFGDSVKIIKVANLPEKTNLPYFFKTKLKDHLSVVYVGRIAPEKNTLYALQQLMNCKQHIQFDLFGPTYDDNYMQQCQSVANQLPANIVVNFKGAINHEDVADTMSKYNAFYLPSTGENFGHSILESMSNSCVPVVSDQTPWTKLESSKIGFDIPLKNPKKYSEALDLLASMDEEEFNIWTKNAWNYAQQVINNKETVKDYHQLFQINN